MDTSLWIPIAAAAVTLLALLFAFRSHPFWALLGAAVAAGLSAGMPVVEVTAGILSGLGSTFANVGLLIFLGALIGLLLERVGAVDHLAAVVSQAGDGQSALRLATGVAAVIGIAVFCDSGFILLAGITTRLSARDGADPHRLTLFVALALYLTHTLVPPTPGPIAMMVNLGLEGNAAVLMVSAMALVGGVLAVMLWVQAQGRGMGRGMAAAGEAGGLGEAGDGEMGGGSGGERGIELKQAMWFLLPVGVPVALMVAGNALRFAGPEAWEGIASILGQPVLALGAGAMVGAVMLSRTGGSGEAGSEGDGQGARAARGKGGDSLTPAAIRTSAEIILLTCMGGSLGLMLREIGVAELLPLGEAGSGGGAMGWTLPLAVFALAAGLKTLQGSSTAALIVVSSTFGPLLVQAGLATPQMVAVYLAIGAGAMVVSHVNDSYFWVIEGFGRIPERTLLRRWTVLTAAASSLVMLVSLGLFALGAG